MQESFYPQNEEERFILQQFHEFRRQRARRVFYHAFMEIFTTFGMEIVLVLGFLSFFTVAGLFSPGSHFWLPELLLLILVSVAFFHALHKTLFCPVPVMEIAKDLDRRYRLFDLMGTACFLLQTQRRPCAASLVMHTALERLKSPPLSACPPFSLDKRLCILPLLLLTILGWYWTVEQDPSFASLSSWMAKPKKNELSLNPKVDKKRFTSKILADKRKNMEKPSYNPRQKKGGDEQPSFSPPKMPERKKETSFSNPPSKKKPPLPGPPQEGTEETRDSHNLGGASEESRRSDGASQELKKDSAGKGGKREEVTPTPEEGKTKGEKPGSEAQENAMARKSNDKTQEEGKTKGEKPGSEAQKNMLEKKAKDETQEEKAKEKKSGSHEEKAKDKTHEEKAKGETHEEKAKEKKPTSQPQKQEDNVLAKKRTPQQEKPKEKGKDKKTKFVAKPIQPLFGEGVKWIHRQKLPILVPDVGGKPSFQYLELHQHHQFVRRAEKYLEKTPIPPEHSAAIRKYFQLIRPTK
jgi:hypothetical protein